VKQVLRIITVLTVVGIISGASLVFVYKYASPLIENNQKEETRSAIFKIYPEAKTYTEKGEELFLVKDKNEKELGYAFIAEGNGYQGKIKIMAGIKEDFSTLLGIEILESQETPGLGQEITSDNFRKQFINLKTSPDIEYVRGKKPDKANEIQAITGATISSRAVVTILNARIEEIKGKD